MLLYGSNIISQLDGSTPESIAAMKIIQAGSHIGLFLIPSLLFARLSGMPIGKYLSTTKLPDARFVLMAIAILAISLPIITLLMQWNMSLELPNWLSRVELWMKNMEENASAVTEVIVKTDNTTQFVFNLLIFAVLPAVGEEFVFRGFLMRWLSSFIRNIHINILIVSILFSALHLQFYGFLPRLALGLLLGYLFYWSGSIWLPIFIHFLNNGLAVLVYFLFESKIINQNPEEIGATENSFVLITNVLVLTVAFWWFHRNRDKKISLDE
jgi:hypothetical protein